MFWYEPKLGTLMPSHNFTCCTISAFSEFVYGMVRDFSLAEDLTQETFLQLHRKLTSFRGESLFTTWLHRMTVNIVLMRLRKRVLPVVSLDQMMTDIPEDYVGRGFGTCDRDANWRC
jgi:RNA polymerase sigma factor (sigma-70 family)